MRIVRILGGLGNQMFQYAFALSLHQLFPDEAIYIDPYAFYGYHLHNGYQIDKIFKQQLPIAPKNKIIKINYPIFHYRAWQIAKYLLPRLKSTYYEKKDMVYDSSVFLKKTPIYYDGYWQSELYFNKYSDIIKNAFQFPHLDKYNENFIKKFDDKITVSVHIRRGDYLQDPLFMNITLLPYYKNAINKILELTAVDTFIIFSNDITWCKNNIIDLTKGTNCAFVDWNYGENAYKDIQLMSMCKHNIVANSSFSWWGAWLNSNKNKVVIAPNKWINTGCVLDIIPESWKTVNISN